eukprot:COSAG02_NODE_5178_length_4568_cov_2.610651_1_plen_193_part_00
MSKKNIQAAAGLATSPNGSRQHAVRAPAHIPTNPVLNPTREPLHGTKAVHAYSLAVPALFGCCHLVVVHHACFAARRSHGCQEGVCPAIQRLPPRSCLAECVKRELCLARPAAAFSAALGWRCGSPATLPPPHRAQQPPTAHPQRRTTSAEPAGAPTSRGLAAIDVTRRLSRVRPFVPTGRALMSSELRHER